MLTIATCASVLVYVYTWTHMYTRANVGPVLVSVINTWTHMYTCVGVCPCVGACAYLWWCVPVWSGLPRASASHSGKSPQFFLERLKLAILGDPL